MDPPNREGDHMKTSIFILIVSLVIAIPAYAEHVYWHQTNQTNSNQYDPDSLNNPFGRYGSRFSPESPNNSFGAGNRFNPDSLSNPYGRYGNQFSPDSPYNKFGQYGNPFSSESTTNPNSPYYNPRIQKYKK